MQEAGFEPAPSKRIVPETIALDHSATLAYIDKSKVEYRNWCDSDFNERKKQTNKQTKKERKLEKKKKKPPKEETWVQLSVLCIIVMFKCLISVLIIV